MVHAIDRKLLLVCAGLLLINGCASLDARPEAIPHYAYLGTYGAAIAAQEGSLGSEKELANQMAEGVGWWVTFQGVEHLIEDAAGRELTWLEKVAVWILPIAVNVNRFFDAIGSQRR